MRQKFALFLIFVMLLTLSGCKSEEKKSAAAADTIVGEQAEESGQEIVPNQENSDEEAEQSTPQQNQVSSEEKQEKPNQSKGESSSKQEEQETQKPADDKPAQKPEEKPADKDEPSEQESSKEEEPEVEEVEIDYSTYIKVASYNIKNLDGGNETNRVVSVLKDIDADIVGLQEVDVYTTRGGSSINQAELLAKECGYPYWHFTRSIPYGGGSYGHAILSRYPIKSSEAVDFKVIAAGDHHRNYARHVVDVNGTELVVYNTHMTLGGDKENGAEMLQVTSAMAKDKYAVLTGDMNMAPDNMGRYVNTKKVTVLNGGDEFVFYVNTFPQGDNSTRPIDNIVVTKTLEHFWDNDNNVGIKVVPTEGSDHNPIYTYIKFKG